VQNVLKAIEWPARVLQRLVHRQCLLKTCLTEAAVHAPSEFFQVLCIILLLIY